ncbi:MAG: TolC family protein [Thauera aminoaromatica]|uniref:TolC family protein n=1 Tax=Thauera aminoaromatica TaxID=164330 RepID=A0A5C7SS52_THASP|nr:MAG: TolC family protein [Thauera aminoaromatica]
MRSKHFTAALALAAGLASQAWAQPAVSLADAVESAWQRTSQSAEVSGQARRALAERAGAGALWAAPPALEVGVVSNRQRAVAATRETEVGIAIPLWLPGQRAARKGQVEAEASAAASNAAAARLRVAGLVREAAAGVALQHAEVAAAQANARELDALAKDVERRVAAGDLARADALSAKAEHLAAVTVLAQARQGLQAAQLRWQALTGLQAVPQLATDVPATRVDEHPAIRAAAVNVELARQRLNVVRTSRSEAPELVVKTRREVTAGEPSINGVGVALRVPFGTASRNEPLMATALSEVELAEATQRELQQQLDADVATARHAADSARQQARDEATRAKLLRERATLIDKSFKAGETPLPELLRAVTAAAQAEAAVSRAQAALAQAASRLQQALGVMP